MAFTDSTPDVSAPQPEVQEEYGFATGFVWKKKRRKNLVVRVTWPIDNTGGEVMPDSLSVGGTSYELVGGNDGRGYARIHGTLTGTYKLMGVWAWVS